MRKQIMDRIFESDLPSCSRPPATAQADSFFHDGMAHGAAARSELNRLRSVLPGTMLRRSCGTRE